MKSQQPAEAELRIRGPQHGRWTWCYVEPETGVELYSNSTFGTREDAMASARKAYPDLDFAEEETAAASPGDSLPGPLL